jgi:hypothetical protein
MRYDDKVVKTRFVRLRSKGVVIHNVILHFLIFLYLHGKVVVVLIFLGYFYQNSLSKKRGSIIGDFA